MGKSLPILELVAPRVREPDGSVQVRPPVPQPRYEPAPLASRPFAAEIEEWLGVLHAKIGRAHV